MTNLKRNSAAYGGGEVEGERGSGKERRMKGESKECSQPEEGWVTFSVFWMMSPLILLVPSTSITCSNTRLILATRWLREEEGKRGRKRRREGRKRRREGRKGGREGAIKL